MKNKFALLESVTTAEERWQNLKQCITEATQKIIPTTKKKEHKKWMTQEILDLMDGRRKVKFDSGKYKSMNKLIKQKCNEAKVEWISQKCQDIEENKKKDYKFMHEKIKEVLTINPNHKVDVLNHGQGISLWKRKTSPRDGHNTLKICFLDERGEKPDIIKPMEGSSILQTEVKRAIKMMKKGKSIGPDIIPVEIFEALDEWGF